MQNSNKRMKTREKLIDSARQIQQEKGYDGLRVEDIVKLSGVAKGTFFSHFDNKDLLLLHLFEEDFSIILDRLKQSPPKDPAQLTLALLPILDFLKDGTLYDLIVKFSCVSSPDYKPDSDFIYFHTLSLLKTWLAELNYPDQDQQLLAEGCCAFLIQVSIQYLSGHFADTQDRNQRFQAYLAHWLARGQPAI